MTSTISSLNHLIVKAERSERVTWQGREALRLENGLALLPDLQLADVSLEAMIGTDNPAYPGLAFRVADIANYELAYAVPHVTGQWDAIQYDPVFHGSNTWQMFHGPCYQQAATVPTGQWFKFKVDVCGERAAISVDDQPPLIVERLAHSPAQGGLGLWTYLPAYFCDLRISPCAGLDVPRGTAPYPPHDAVDAWLVEGYGVAMCEPNGALNLNRCLPMSAGSTRLIRRFELSEAAEVAFEFGFSDALTLELDGHRFFEGETRFKGFANRTSRGYVEPIQSQARQIEAGTHCLSAELRVSEPFGWGLALAVHGANLRWLPTKLG